MTDMDVMAEKPRSTFVTVTAWIFIVLSGLGILMGILQNLIVAFVFTQETFAELFGALQEENMPGYMVYILENIQLILFLSLLLTILLFTSSIGLLKRKNWARRVFVSYLLVFAVYMVVGSVFQHNMMSAMMSPIGSQTSAPSSFQTIMEAMQYTALIFNIGLGLVFGRLHQLPA